jgi:hypothetical protein
MQLEQRPSSRSNKLRRERAVEAISKRKGTLLFSQPQGWQTIENLLDNVFVFFRLKTARAVNNDTARFQQANHSAHNRDLPLMHARKVRRG